MTSRHELVAAERAKKPADLRQAEALETIADTLGELSAKLGLLTPTLQAIAREISKRG